jgi:NTE family protein
MADHIEDLKSVTPLTTERPEQLVLVLQGGGALGAYQGGAYEALRSGGKEPEWFAGISIGAINAAIICGNRPEDRGLKLRQFWDGISSGLLGNQVIPGDAGRSLFNETSSALATVMGVNGFFMPRLLPPMLQRRGSVEALSYYDTAPLRQTLESLIDFDMLNHKAGPRLSIGAVNVVSGNLIYFDSLTTRITVDHILASSALPPGFPPVLIDKAYYWDGGLVSNTPLQYVIDNASPERDLTIFQVDLFSATGAMPQTIMDVAEREKEIRFSSRTRLNTTLSREIMELRKTAKRLAERLPSALQDDPDLKALIGNSSDGAISIFHLIHRPTVYDTQSKDYEFSRISMVEHWAAGHADASTTLQHPAWINRARQRDGVSVFDLAKVISESNGK